MLPSKFCGGIDGNSWVVQQKYKSEYPACKKLFHGVMEYYFCHFHLKKKWRVFCFTFKKTILLRFIAIFIYHRFHPKFKIFCANRGYIAVLQWLSLKLGEPVYHCIWTYLYWILHDIWLSNEREGIHSKPSFSHECQWSLVCRYRSPDSMSAAWSAMCGWGRIIRHFLCFPRFFSRKNLELGRLWLSFESHAIDPRSKQNKPVTLGHNFHIHSRVHSAFTWFALETFS